MSVVVQCWLTILLFWPIGDLLRKWAGNAINQLVYLLDYGVIALILLVFWRQGAYRLQPSLRLPLLLLLMITLPNLGSLLLQRGLPYLGIYILSLLALVGPFLLVGCRSSGWKFDPHFLRLGGVLVASLALINNLLTVFQSLLGKDHWLSATTAGSPLGTQIAANVDKIELRSPGLFSVVNSNATFTCVSLVLLAVPALWMAAPLGGERLLRILAIVSVPVAAIRAVSRTYLLQLAAVLFPLLPSILRPAIFGRLIVFATVIPFLSLLLLPEIQQVVTDGLSSVVLRFSTADNLLERVAQIFTTDASGSSRSLLTVLPRWFILDPLSCLCGFGLGLASPLNRFQLGAADPSYGQILVDGYQFLLGENPIFSLLSELGVLGFLSYCWFVIESLRILVSEALQLSGQAQRAGFALILQSILLVCFGAYFRTSSFLGQAYTLMSFHLLVHASPSTPRLR